MKRKHKQRGYQALGFKSYYEYLQSHIWANIRSRVLDRDDHKCLVCTARAFQVHHRTYNMKTLAGSSLKGLVSLCRKCHEHIEFTDGVKNDISEANRKLKQLISQRIGKKHRWSSKTGGVHT